MLVNWYIRILKDNAKSTSDIPSLCDYIMDSSRAAAVASSVLAQEALSLVSAHHPRGLASFAVDAHVASSELSLALSASFRGVRLAYALARPYKGCVPDRRLLADYRSLYAVHLVLWAVANDAADHLSTFTRGMDSTAFVAFERAVTLHQKSAQ